MNTIETTAEQDRAIESATAWYQSFLERRASSPVFKLFGYAGTGKTTIARRIADKCGGGTFAAFTGKAASILKAKGCTDATTIHKLIYKPTDKTCVTCQKVGMFQGGKCRNCGADEHNPELDVDFSLSGHTIDRTGLVVIDECSMVGEELGGDIINRGGPILALGDPAQLPPVSGGGFFTTGEPDALLQEIHRQKDGCGILDIATDVRNGVKLRYGRYEESEVVRYVGAGGIDVGQFDQVLVGTNNSRRKWNALIRDRLGFSGTTPMPGDKLICLRNNYELGLMNGEQVFVVNVESQTTHDFVLTFRRDGAKPDEIETVRADRHYLDGREGHPKFKQSTGALFDFGWAITTHKAQGSQWPRVLVLNESRCFREDAAKWLYTAVTRASERVVVVGA